MKLNFRFSVPSRRSLLCASVLFCSSSVVTACAIACSFREKVSLIMTAPDLWLCVNVGVDGVDIMAKEMSVVWLVVDFFSSYHRSDVRENSIVMEGI